MATRMVHPDHGVTHAVGAEVEWNQRHGWRVEEKRPKEVATQVATPVEEEAPPKRRGRPPKVK